MDNIKKINENTNSCSAILYNGKITSEGNDPFLRKSVFFDNDVTLDKTNTNSYADILCESFTTKNVSFSFWIKPTKESNINSSIIVNKINKLETGLFYNINEKNSQLGFKWSESELTTPTNLGLSLPNDTWSHVVIIFTEDGYINLCGNGIYLGSITNPNNFDEVNFSSIRIGGFCGMLDDLKIFDYALSFGPKLTNTTATEEVGYLFNLNRITGQLDYINSIEDDPNYYYIQSSEYTNAYENYLLEKKHKQPFYGNESKVPIVGGTNEGNLVVADGKFRIISGEIKTNQK